MIEIILTAGTISGIVSGKAMISFLPLIALLIAVSASRRRTRKALKALVPILIILAVLPVIGSGQIKLDGTSPDPDPDLYTKEAKNMLYSIADAQIWYFAQNNRWAGYPDNKGVFQTLAWRPQESSHYAYYCGKDYILPKTNIYSFNFPDPQAWPYGLYPDITLDDFVCMAIGNNDDDQFPDVWMINKFKRPLHLLDDAKNKVLIDIVSRPFDVKNYFARAFAAEGDKNIGRVYIEVNLPAYRLDLYEDGRRLASYNVAIGMRAYKTPIRNFYMERIEWNPWWIPPNAAWCKQKDEEGNEIGCKPKGPGPSNPLGPVKMVLQSSILIHGTNKPGSVGHAASHSCMRMVSDNAAELAWKIMVLAGTVQPLYPKEVYKDRSRRTYKIIPLTHVQVATVYKRMEVYENKLLLHPDVYGWQHMSASTIQEKLKHFNLPMTALDPGKKDLLFSGSSDTIEIPIRL